MSNNKWLHFRGMHLSDFLCKLLKHCTSIINRDFRLNFFQHSHKFCQLIIISKKGPALFEEKLTWMHHPHCFYHIACTGTVSAMFPSKYILCAGVILLGKCSSSTSTGSKSLEFSMKPDKINKSVCSILGQYCPVAFSRSC